MPGIEISGTGPSDISPSTMRISPWPHVIGSCLLSGLRITSAPPLLYPIATSRTALARMTSEKKERCSSAHAYRRTSRMHISSPSSANRISRMGDTLASSLTIASTLDISRLDMM